MLREGMFCSEDGDAGFSQTLIPTTNYKAEEILP
jgi:hypothetical protein